MSFFQFNEDEAKSIDVGGSIETGVYDVTIDTVSTRVASSGTQGLDYSFVLDDGRKAIVYGSWIKKTDGTILIDGQKLSALMGIVGAKQLTEYDKTIDVKDGKKIVSALKELDGKKIKVALQVEHDIYNGEERQNLKIHTFFGTDGLTYSEKSIGQKETKKLDYLKANLKDSYTKRFKQEQSGESIGSEPSESLL